MIFMYTKFWISGISNILEIQPWQEVPHHTPFFVSLSNLLCSFIQQYLPNPRYMPEVFLALSRNCGMILTKCFLCISICLQLLIRSYWFSIPSVPLLPLQLLEMVEVASEVVSAFSLLFSSSSSLLPSCHVTSLTTTIAGARCPWDTLEAWVQGLVSYLTFALNSAYSFHVLFSLPVMAHWNLLFLA